MSFRAELTWSVGAVIVINACLAFFAVGLFWRMAPAIEHILDRNASSIADSSIMLVALAQPNQGEDERTAVRSAFEHMRQNVTEPAESQVVADVESVLQQDLDPDRRGQLAKHVGQLAAINQSAMTEAGAAASRLGTAGAWAAVWVGLFSVMVSLLVLGRLRRRLIEPLEELQTTLDEVTRANPLRRCHGGAAPPALRAVLQDVNELLDRTTRDESGGQGSNLSTLALSRMAELVAQPVAVVDYGGRIHCANQAMLDALAGAGGEHLRAALMSADVADMPNLSRKRLPDATGYLCTLKQTAPV